MSTKEQEKLDRAKRELMVYCKCSHSIFMPVYRKKAICSHCGNLVFRNDKEEFKYRIGRLINV